MSKPSRAFGKGVVSSLSENTARSPQLSARRSAVDVELPDKRVALRLGEHQVQGRVNMIPAVIAQRERKEPAVDLAGRQVRDSLVSENGEYVRLEVALTHCRHRL